MDASISTSGSAWAIADSLIAEHGADGNPEAIEQLAVAVTCSLRPISDCRDYDKVVARVLRLQAQQLLVL